MPLGELATRLIDALPNYGRQLVALLLRPKSSVLEQDLESDSALQQALTFLAISFGISFIAQMPFLPAEGNKEVIFGTLAIQSALTFALNVAFTLLAWRIVGGKLAGKKFVAATCYFSGVSTILFLAMSLIAEGAFNMLDPSGFHQSMTGKIDDPVAMFGSQGFHVFIVILLLAFLITYLWIFIVWGAYRQLLHLTRLRSGIALALFVAFTPFLLLAQTLLYSATSSPSTAPAVPPELVGQWETSHQGSTNGINWQDIDAYRFLAPHDTLTGTYLRFQLKNSVENKCLLQLIHQESGRIVVAGQSLTLIPQQHTQTTKNSCTGQSAEAPMDLGRTEYRFKVDQQPTGWILCLSDRFGQTCLTPRKTEP